MLKTLIYKLYVIALMVFVLWAAQLFYSIIYWEFEYTGVSKTLRLQRGEPEMLKLRKIRHFMDNDMQTRTHDLGDVKLTEHYQAGHFHHVGQTITEPSLNGCDYCHTVVPHILDEEARAFRNMHGYFLACETCHYLTKFRRREIEYGWVQTKTEETISRPLALIRDKLSHQEQLGLAKGNYGARIVPYVKFNDGVGSIIAKSSLSQAESLLEDFDKLPRAEVKDTLARMHKGLTKKPYKCDACHTKKNAILSYRELGYSKEDAENLRDTAVASVISKYDKFHFPDLFIRKDDRNREQGINF